MSWSYVEASDADCARRCVVLRERAQTECEILIVCVSNELQLTRIQMISLAAFTGIGTMLRNTTSPDKTRLPSQNA